MYWLQLMFIFFFKSLKNLSKAQKLCFSKSCINNTTLNLSYLLTYQYLVNFYVFEKGSFFFKKTFFKVILFYKKTFFKKFMMLAQQKYMWCFFNKFVLNFCEFFFKRKFLFFLKKKSTFNKKALFLKIFSKIKPPYGIKYSRLELIYIIYYSLLLKDAVFFLNYIRRFFESNKIKSHKKIFFF